MNIIIAVALLLALPAQAQEQTRFYGPDGRSAGTAAPYGTGSTRYYDPSGKTIGTSTTTGGTTTFYDARGNVVGRSTAPSTGKVSLPRFGGEVRSWDQGI